HDFDQSGVPVDQDQAQYALNQPEGYGVSIWDNVAFADVYYQTQLVPNSISPLDNLLYPAGRPIPGAYNVFLDGADLYWPDDLIGDLSENYHSWVWANYYVATIKGSTIWDSDPEVVKDSINGIDLGSGYAYSRLADILNPTSVEVDGTVRNSDRPAMDNFATGQDHEHTPSAIWDNGQLNASGIASLGLTNTDGEAVTAANLATVSWAPEWTPEIVNGTFEDIYLSYTDPLDWWEFSGIQPGWSHHGAGETLSGGGGGDVEAHWILDNSYLELDSGDVDRTHNRFYIPGDVSTLYFDYDVTTAGTNDFLKVYLDDLSDGTDNLIFTLDLSTTTSGFVQQPIDLSTSPLTGDVRALTFELVDSLDASVDANVIIDDVSFDGVSPNDDPHLRTYSVDGLRSVLGQVIDVLSDVHDHPLSGYDLPLIDASLNDAIDPTLTVLNDIDDALETFDNAQHTAQELFDSILALLSGNGTSSPVITTDELLFNFDLDFQTAFNTSLNFGAAGTDDALSFDATADIAATASLDFDFSLGLDFSDVDLNSIFSGIDLTGLDYAERISALSWNPLDYGELFIQINSPLTFDLDVDVTDLAVGVDIGLLEAGIQGGTVTLDIGAQIAFDSLDSDADSRISFAELTAIDLDSLLTKTNNSFSATLPVVVNPNGFKDPLPSVTIGVSKADLFNNDLPVITVTGDLPDFSDLSLDDIGALLNQFNGYLSSLTGFDALETLYNTKLPFTNGQTVGDILDLSQKFKENIVDKLIDPVTGDFLFSSLQELATILNTELGLQDVFTITADGELLFDFGFTKSLTSSAVTNGIDLGFDINDPAGLADISVSADTSLSGNATFDLTLGIDLNTVGTNLQASLFALPGTVISADFDLLASGVNGNARLGFIDVGIVDGTVIGDASAAISLLDVVPNGDGKITLSEFSSASASDLVSATADGWVYAALPLSASFGGLTIPAGPETTVTIGISDITDPATTIYYHLPSTDVFNELLNFTNMNAASFVSLLGQLSNWLDEMRTSGKFDVDIPLADAALEEVLGFAEMISAKLLYDKGSDHIVDQDDTLLVDINVALEDAGLRDQILAVADADRSITLVAIDPAIDSFTVSANSSDLGGFAQFTLESQAGAVCDKLVMTPSSVEGKLTLDAGFDIVLTVNGETLSGVPVLLSAAATTANVRIGNDVAKLIREDNSATFNTVEDLVSRLLCLLPGTDSETITYDPLDAKLELNLGSLLNYTYAEEFPLDFAFELGPLLDIESDSTVAVEATVGFDENFTIGLFLGDQVPGANGNLSFGTDLSTLNDGDGVNIKTDLALTAPTTPVVYGRLSGDATFDLTINNGTTYQVTVEEGVANGTDYVSFSGDSSVENDRITFATNHGLSNGDQVVYNNGGDVGVGGLRDGKSYYVVNKTNNSLQLSATSDGTALSLTDGGSDSNHRLIFASGSANKTMSDLAADINAALAEAGVGTLVEAGYSNDLHRIAIVAKSASVNTISVSVDSNDPASRDIGLTSGSVSQEEIELVTYWAQKAVTALYGRLEANMGIQFNIGNGIGIVVDKAVTAT
ncbi:MAG: hypothetical protein C0619_09990, partial [Desulfuromonas sp.]